MRLGSSFAFYHQKTDRPDVIDPAALSNGLKIALEWIAGADEARRNDAAVSLG